MATATLLCIPASWPASARESVSRSIPVVAVQDAGAPADSLPHKNAFRRFGTVRFRNGDGILSLAYSPSGKIIASGGRNEPVHIWDVKKKN